MEVLLAESSSPEKDREAVRGFWVVGLVSSGFLDLVGLETFCPCCVCQA